MIIFLSHEKKHMNHFSVENMSDYSNCLVVNLELKKCILAFKCPQMGDDDNWLTQCITQYRFILKNIIDTVTLYDKRFLFIEQLKETDEEYRRYAHNTCSKQEDSVEKLRLLFPCLFCRMKYPITRLDILKTAFRKRRLDS